jgi:tetratricopeptide (TPR) repeat protein
MQFNEYIKRIQETSQLIKGAHYQEAIDAIYKLILSDISDIDKADLCVKLAYSYDRLGNTSEAMDWYEKGISYEQNYCRFEVAEMKAQYLSELGLSNQAVPIYESLMKQPFVSEIEKERMRKTIQSYLMKAIRDWQ